VLVLLLLAVAAVAVLGYARVRAQGEPRLIVLFQSPQQGDRVNLGQSVSIHAVARDDEERVARIELWLDGRLVAAETSSLEGGVSPLPVVAVWPAEGAGSHTIVALATNPQGAQAQARVVLEVVGAPDGDGDGVPDAEDACPAEAGAAPTRGCPDRDGDGVADAFDACPEAAGLDTPDGCPAPTVEDRDGDGVADGEDACPDEAGPPRTLGCPDADGDGVPDGDDACPAEPGLPEADGCAAPPDRDGDGVADGGDYCPDEPGPEATEGCPDRDGDGVADATDACPDEPGVLGAPGGDGCPVAADDPDRDGDTLVDSVDDCPDEPGPLETGGCPDRDGDGVRDAEDLCPDEPGPGPDGCREDDGGDAGGDRDGDGVPDAIDDCPEEAGEPADGCPGAAPGDGTITEVGDADGDGLSDREDLCPAEPGLPEDSGCPPPPTLDPGDGGGIIPWPEGAQGVVAVEFRAYDFRVFDDYDDLSCYVRLGTTPVERVGPFEPLSERQWMIPAELASRPLSVALGEPLAVQIECGAGSYGFSGDSGWGTYWDLGAYLARIDAENWDGRALTASSEGGDSGHGFEAHYRLCLGSCETTAWPRPVLSLLPLVDLFGDNDGAQLSWTWEGDGDMLEGYNVYVDGSLVQRVEGSRSLVVSGYKPLCGSDRREFAVTAYGGGAESPPSNSAFWGAEPCPRQVRVTFETLHTRDLPDGGEPDDGVLGPIFGTFSAQGATGQYLTFDAGDDYRDGTLLDHRDHSVADLFYWIRRLGHSAPESNSVVVELGPDDDLTLSGILYDTDWRGYSTVFDASETIANAHVAPGVVALSDGAITLDVLIDIIGGPGAGDKPDLMITGLSTQGESGQLRIQVHNNGADLVNQNVPVRLETLVSRAEIATLTWEDVTIPSGGERSFQSAELVREPYDLRAIVDPGDLIDEMIEDNNSYATPVQMAVGVFELMVTTPPCESWTHQHAELYWEISVGHGTSASEVEWLRHVRYPETGEISLERGAVGEWTLGGEASTLDVTIPADERLWVRIEGWESDAGDDDPMGAIQRSYGPADNWGGGSSSGWVLSSGEGTSDEDCDEDMSPGIDNYWWMGFQARWQIARLY